MKKNLIALFFLSTLLGCNKDNNSNSSNGSNIKWKLFKVVAMVECETPTVVQPLTNAYINFWILSNGGEEPNSSFTPKPNTWYKINNFLYYKTGSDVTPIDDSSGAFLSMNASTTAYTQPCQ